MDPASMPAWGSTPNTQGQLTQGIANLAPLATEYHGAQTGVDIGQIANRTAPMGNLEKFGHFLGGLGTQTGHLAFGAAKWLGQNALGPATAPVRFGEALGHAGLPFLNFGSQDWAQLHSVQAQNKVQSDRMDTLNSQYKSGQITKVQYTAALKSLMQDQQNTSSQEDALLHRLPTDQHQAIQSAIDTASTLVTVLTAGLGKAYSLGVTAKGLEPLAAKTTADYLASTNANVFFNLAEQGVQRLSSDPELFSSLTPMAQKIIQTGVGEVIAQGGTLTAGQIMRASVANIAFKYPIYYQWMSAGPGGTGGQLYDELDQKKYGDAVRTIAFNAALMLSGGPIGKALGVLGTGTTILKNALFARSTFLDELSRAVGDGDPAGLFNSINKISDTKLKADVIRQISAVEATNTVAMGGDAKAAAWRVTKGMANYEGVSLNTFSHDELLNNMVNFAKAQRLADFYGKRLGTTLTVGRADARAFDTIAAGITRADVAEAEAATSLDAIPKTTQEAVDMSKAPDFLQPEAKAAGGEGNKLPEALQKVQDALPKGYTVQADGSVVDNAGKELTTGQIQDLTQAPYLTEFEKASRENDVATMERIAKEHPDDGRVSMGSIAATTEGPTELPALSADKKAALMAKARQEAATQATAQTMSPTEQRLQAWEDLKAQNPNQAWANNDNLDKQIKALINKHDDPSELDAAIRKVGQMQSSFTVKGLPENAVRDLAKMGYIPIKPSSLEAPFVEGGGKVTSAFAKTTDDFFMKAVKPLPVLSSIGDMLTGMGLSPNSATQQVYQQFNGYFAKNLEQSGIVKDLTGETSESQTDALLKRLSDYAHNPTVGKLRGMPITDFRMLTVKDIQAATGLTEAESHTMQRALARAYIQVPLELRGLGDRVVDYLYGGPQGVLARKYFRLQGALRFSWNPFFEYMRVIPKTEILTESQGGGLVNSIFTGRAGQIPEVRTMLRDAGMFDEASKIGNVMGAEAADAENMMGRNISKHLLSAQEMSISGLVISQADRMGLSVEDYIRSDPQRVRDTIQAIAQYDRHANFLNSPMMRTLNVAVFPIRFETKVATFLAKGLAAQPLMTQVAFINGLMQAHAFLNSPQGIAWYSRNSTAIALFDYITPLAEMNKVFESLLPGHDHSLGNFGSLGGLPFGWIPTLTDAEGLTHFSQPGVAPDTGQTYTQYIPIDMRGQVAVAIQDFIGSLFSYPGAEAGLPSKSSIMRNLSYGFTGATKTKDFKTVTPNLNQQQLNYQQAVQAANSNIAPQGETVNQQAGLVPSQTVPGLMVPSTDSPLLHPYPRLRSGTARKKKGQYIPQALPGQSTLGQLQEA